MMSLVSPAGGVLSNIERQRVRSATMPSERGLDSCKGDLPAPSTRGNQEGEG